MITSISVCLFRLNKRGTTSIQFHGWLWRIKKSHCVRIGVTTYLWTRIIYYVLFTFKLFLNPPIILTILLHSKPLHILNKPKILKGNYSTPPLFPVTFLFTSHDRKSNNEGSCLLHDSRNNKYSLDQFLSGARENRFTNFVTQAQEPLLIPQP